MSSLADKLAGFKPEASSEGEWQPYNGVYKCRFQTLRVDYDEKNQGTFIQTEYEIDETLDGDQKRESKFPAFRKRYYLDFDAPTEDHLENAKELANVVFTATGLELNFGSKESFKESAEAIIGKEAYIRAWGWTPDKDRNGNSIPDENKKTLQQFRVMKKAVAEKKRSASSVAF